MTLITTEPDMNIEPGHQWLVVDASPEGYCLATLLLNNEMEKVRSDGEHMFIAHTHDVDRRLVALIDELSHVRYSAPQLLQLTMEAAKE